MAYFGVARDAFTAEDWMQQAGLKPDVLGLFENWDNQRTLEKQFDKARSLGINRVMITWEPWSPTSSSDPADQGAYQNRWSSEAIANGQHDSYINDFAVSIRDSGLSMVYIRLMHEMNGDWYPWCHDPDAYVRAWKRIHLQFAKKNTKDNVRWVWTPNASLYQDKRSWLRDALPYWPGTTMVDYVGSTMINFGGSKNYTISQFADRFTLMKYIFEKSAIAAEFNVAYELRDQWLTEFAAWVNEKDPLYMAMLSQGSSRAASAGGTGDMSWQVTDDTMGAARMRNLADALHT